MRDTEASDDLSSRSESGSESSEEDNDEDDIRDEASNWPYPSRLCSAHSLD